MPHHKVESAGIELRLVYTVSPYEAMLVSHALFAAAGDEYWRDNLARTWTEKERSIVMDVARVWERLDNAPITFTNPYEHAFIKELTRQIKAINDYQGRTPADEPPNPACTDERCLHPQKAHTAAGEGCNFVVTTASRTYANCPCSRFVPPAD